MRVGPYIEKLDQTLWVSRILQVSILAMTIVILVLARQHTIVHVAPPDFRRAYDIGPSTASRDYIEQMTSFLVVNALTVNPESAEFSAKSFLRFLTPEARGKLETAILGDAEWIKKNAVAQAFYPRIIDFYGPTKLRLTGTLVQWTAGRLVTSRDVSIDLQITIANYTLLIKDFAYVTDDSTRATHTSRVPTHPAAPEP